MPFELILNIMYKYNEVDHDTAGLFKVTGTNLRLEHKIKIPF